MSLAKEFPCGHLRFLPSRYKSCPVCREAKVKAAAEEFERHRRSLVAANREESKRAKRRARV